MILTRPSRLPGYVESPCDGCGCLLDVPSHAEALCQGCRRQRAQDAARLLAGAIDDLVMGDGVFEGMLQSERQEQLNALGVLCTAR